jgi:hypothetical protein
MIERNADALVRNAAKGGTITVDLSERIHRYRDVADEGVRVPYVF